MVFYILPPLFLGGVSVDFGGVGSLFNYIGRQIKKKKNCICDEYVINLFVCIYEVIKGT